jgi:hypothetical protein
MVLIWAVDVEDLNHNEVISMSEGRKRKQEEKGNNSVIKATDQQRQQTSKLPQGN